MSKHAPWTDEEAEKWAKEHALKVRSCSESAQRHEDSEQDFLAGLAKAAEFIAKSPTRHEFIKVIEDWKHAWMNVKGTDVADASNYFERAFGIDANMKYDLARRLVKMKSIEKGKTDGE